MLVTIRERAAQGDGFDAELAFDNDPPTLIHVQSPFDEETEKRLQWYFERHLEYPNLHTVKAQQAAQSVTEYGVKLFEMLFANRKAYARYEEGKQAGIHTLRFEIAGSPEFHRLHWEALCDPELPRPFAVEAPFVRKNLTEQAVRSKVRPSPTLNVLVVTARPGGRGDVGYRTISRPLVEHLKNSDTPVQLDILRPGTYKALVEHLEEKRGSEASGYYHILHFDLHGALLEYDAVEKVMEPNALLYKSRYGRKTLEPYDGTKAFLAFVGEKEGLPDLVEAGEMAELLIAHQIPIVILNACQSAMQEGDEETSLASRLMQAGVQMALGMAYSVTVTAAERMMTTLYKLLFEGKTLAEAIRRARLELLHDQERRAYFNQTIDLEDWLLPVVYQNQDQTLTRREFTPEESAAYYQGIAEQEKFPEPTYGFFGRDIDILEIETHLLTKRNLLLVRGMGGTGKTTLLRHLAAWWQTTDFVEQVFYFGYDERAWTRQQILNAIAQKLLSPAEYAGTFTPMSDAAKQARVVKELRAKRHLLVLDNLESITGEPLSIPNTLPKQEQDALHSLLRDLLGGKTVVLLGSRSEEKWLAPGTFEDNAYGLAGLDKQAASDLADAILEKLNVTPYREDKEFARLLRLLDGYPLAMEVVLANLTRQTPGEILSALEAGDISLDNKEGKDKTKSILQCIAYSHSNLDPGVQELLLCLAPFTSVLFAPMLNEYLGFLKQQSVLAHLPFERMEEALGEANRWGLLSPHAQMPAFLSLQPTFPYFLRSMGKAPEQVTTRQAVETAFRQHYEQFGGVIYQLILSNEAQKRQAGTMLAHLEYENLMTALNLALASQVSILGIYPVLSSYLDVTHEEQRGLELGEAVLARLQAYPPDVLSGPLGGEFAAVLDEIAKRQFLLKRFVEAESFYQKALDLLLANTSIKERVRKENSAGIYHQLGLVAHDQRHWEQAEQHYKQALQTNIEIYDRTGEAQSYYQIGEVAREQEQWTQAQGYYQQALQIFVELNARDLQPLVYRGLGIVATRQQQWTEAEQYYQKALQINIEFNDRHAQAMTYGNLGTLAGEQNQFEQEEFWYQQQLQIYIEFNDRYRQATVYRNLGASAASQEQWAQAREYFLRAYSIFEEFQVQHEAADMLRRMAWLWQVSGDAETLVALASIFGLSVEETEKQLREHFAGEAPGAGP